MNLKAYFYHTNMIEKYLICQTNIDHDHWELIFRLIGAALLLFTLGLYVAYLIKVRPPANLIEFKYILGI